jgi:hypothetical protein
VPGLSAAYGSTVTGMLKAAIAAAHAASELAARTACTWCRKGEGSECGCNDYCGIAECPMSPELMNSPFAASRVPLPDFQ